MMAKEDAFLKLINYQYVYDLDPVAGFKPFLRVNEDLKALF